MTLNFIKENFHINGTEGVKTPFTFFERGFRLGGGGSEPTWQDIIISGNTALTLVNAKTNGLNYLKLFGGCEQRTLPKGYTAIEYIQSSGTQYINTGIRGEAKVVIDCQGAASSSTSEIIIGSYTYPPSFFGQAGSTGKYGFNANALTDVDYTTRKTFTINFNDSATVEYDSTTIQYTDSGTLYTSANYALFRAMARSSTNYYYAKARIYSVTFEQNGVYVAKMYPAKRDSDNELGMYDTVRNTFYTNSGSGSFTAGDEVTPTPDNPIDIVCNNGTLKLRNKNGVPSGYTQLEYLQSNGGSSSGQCINTGVKADSEVVTYEWEYEDLPKTKAAGSSSLFGCEVTSKYSGILFNNSYSSTDTTIKRRLFAGSGGVEPLYDFPLDSFIKCKLILNNGNYELYQNNVLVGQGTYEGTLVTNLDIYLFSNKDSSNAKQFSKCKMKHFKITKSGNVACNLFPARRNSDNAIGMYDTISETFLTNIGTGSFTTGDVDYSAYEVYADGTTETVKDSLDNTATAEMLLAVSENYRDVQEVLTGAITRNVAVKVLDGTEDWNTLTLSRGYYSQFPNIAGVPYNENSWCTHFYKATWATQTNPMSDNRFGFNKNANASVCNGNVTFKPNLTDIPTVADWKAFLANEYAKGTPVIVIYPLATATTETVTGQTLTTQRGTNVIEITQASIDGLPLEVSYKAGVTVTVEEVENANLDDSVTVTIEGENNG